jgi:hypothetical protein
MGDGTVKMAGIGTGGMRNKRKKKVRLMREAIEMEKMMKQRERESREREFEDDWGGYLEDNRNHR